jgi:hypothetical protein
MLTSCSARSLASTIAPSMRIMSRMPATFRWSKAWTSMPRRIRSAATVRDHRKQDAF